MPATNFMSALMLDPRAYLLNPLFCDPAALALLQQQPPFASLAQEQHNGGGKIIGSTANQSMTSSNNSNTTTATNSFRILDILESHARSNRSNSSSGSEKANTSGENDESMEDESADDPNASGRSGFGSNSLHSNSKKARKARTIFTDKQLQELETMFEKHKYLSVQDRMDLAHRMGLTDTQVKTWYQNRRTKWKRQAAVGVDLLQEPSNFAVIQNLLRTNPYWMQHINMSNPSIYPFIAQRLMPNMINQQSNQQSTQQQSPSSRPQSTNNNCVSNSTPITENPSPITTMPNMNSFPLFFAGLNGNFGLQNTNITTSSNSANSSPNSTTPKLQEGNELKVIEKSPVSVQHTSP